MKPNKMTRGKWYWQKAACVSLYLWNISNLMTEWAELVLGWAEFGSFFTSSNSMRCHTRHTEIAGQNWNQWGAEQATWYQHAVQIGTQELGDKHLFRLHINLLSVLFSLCRKGRVNGGLSWLGRIHWWRMMEKIAWRMEGGREHRSWPS